VESGRIYSSFFLESEYDLLRSKEKEREMSLLGLSNSNSMVADGEGMNFVFGKLIREKKGGWCSNYLQGGCSS